jgi:hypothetical protein
MPSILLWLPIHLRDRHPPAARGSERNIPNASILNAHDDRAIREHGEMNPITGLEIRRRPNVFRYRRLTLACHCRLINQLTVLVYTA